MFGCEPDELSFNSKKNRFQDQMRLNQRSKTKVVHIPINFVAGEKLTNDSPSTSCGIETTKFIKCDDLDP